MRSRKTLAPQDAHKHSLYKRALCDNLRTHYEKYYSRYPVTNVTKTHGRNTHEKRRTLMTNRLQTLLDKRAKLDAQIKAAQARSRSQARKDDTRRKIIIGALAKDHMAMHPNSAFAQELRALLNEHVKRPKDRALLNLEQDNADGAPRAKPDFVMVG